jgi:hypothetical protein
MFNWCLHDASLWIVSLISSHLPFFS